MLENSLSDSDAVLEAKGLKIILRKADMEYLTGSEIHYVARMRNEGSGLLLVLASKRQYRLRDKSLDSHKSMAIYLFSERS